MGLSRGGTARGPARPARRLLAALLVGLLLVPLLAACGRNASGAEDIARRKVRVTTTVGMITDVVKNVGGERVEVTGLMGPGVDPHLYKPSATDTQKLESADIIFYGGLELEGRMTDLLVKLARSGKRAVPVTEEIPEDRLREPEEFEGKFDPHVWFDVTLWQYAARTINKQLAELDPNSKDLYQRNTDAYLKQLDELHGYTKAQIATIPQQSRVLITAHDAFGYFGQQYGMEVRGLQGTSTASEASAADVQELAGFIADRKIKAIFVESSVPRATIEAVQAAVQSRGWNVAIGGELFSDAMGNDGTPEGTYIGMVRHNVDTIVKALK
jgi:manganese/zinc/iron transport system substrate-binding protein